MSQAMIEGVSRPLWTPPSGPLKYEKEVARSEGKFEDRQEHPEAEPHDGQPLLDPESRAS